jgi:DNA-binding MarR family transcriptional regulator
MPNKPAKRPDFTPAGRLAEADLLPVVGYQLAQASVTTTRVFKRLVEKPLGLRRVEYTILMLISENPGCSAARLARALDVTAPNITTSIARLEERGWVEREQSATDGRSQHLHLSGEGEALTQEATRRLLAGEREALDRLTQGERAILVELLHKVASSRPVPAKSPG